MCRPGPIQIISSHISSDGSLLEVGAQPPSGGPQELSDASDVKNAPNGANNIVEGEAPDYKVALKGPQLPKISAHEQFVRNLYAEASKLSSKRSVADLDGLVKTAKAVDKGAKTNIQNLVKAVKTSIAALNKLTGRQIADFSHPANDAAFKALTDVLNAHEDLALALTELGAGKSLEVSRPLQEAANMLNKRICTITQLVGDLNARMLQADSEGLDLRNQFDRVSQIAGRRSGAEEKMVDVLSKLTKPLEDELKSFSSSTRPITDAMVKSAQEKLKKIRADAEFLASCAGGTRTLTKKETEKLATLGLRPQEIVNVKPSAFTDIRKVLARASDQLGQAHLKGASKAAALRMVNALRIPGAEVIANMDKLLKTRPFPPTYDTSFLRGVIDQFAKCQKSFDALRKAVLAEVNGKNPDASRNATQQAQDALEAVLGDLADAIKRLKDHTEAQPKAFTGLKHGKILSAALAAGSKSLDRAFNADRDVIVKALKDQIGTVRDLTSERKNGRSWYDPQVMSRILDEPEVFMTVVEARAHGIDLSLVDLDCSTKNLVKKEPLGSGTFSTAYLCTFKRPDGSTVQRVFKPDLAATEGLLHGVHSTLGGVKDPGLQHALHYNVALHDVATLLGAGSTVCRSSAAYVDGEFGFLMEVADGVGSATINEKKTFGKGTDGADFKLKTFEGQSIEKKKVAFAQMAEQLSQLQWTDLIGGQLDRHGENYAIKVTKDGPVTIKGFDNDQSLAAELVGIGKVRVPEWKYLVKKINKRLKKQNSSNKVDKSYLEKLFTENGANLYQVDERGRVTIDISALKTGEQFWALIYGTGLRSIAVPTYMDRGTYDRIKALTKEDGSGLKLFRETLQKRKMNAQQIDAAVTRLLEARDIADELMKANRVYTREQLANENVLRQIIYHDEHWNEMQRDISLANGDDITDCMDKYGSNYLNRPAFYNMIKAAFPPNDDDLNAMFGAEEKEVD